MPQSPVIFQSTETSVVLVVAPAGSAVAPAADAVIVAMATKAAIVAQFPFMSFISFGYFMTRRSSLSYFVSLM